MKYDDPMFEAQNGGAAGWLIGWPLLLVAALLSILFARFRRDPVRFLAVCLFFVCAFFAGTGCTINRTGSILPDVKLIEINDSLNGSANGNTVTPGGF